ncbi:MAG: hypothetical protein JKY52_13615 [Flavobacteriales bacterium]|nr:hypothetical protein [Flavobacteriales bacterium]
MKQSLKTLTFAILAGLLLSTTACTKCQTCKHVASNGVVLLTWESCGDKDASAVQKDDCNTAANNTPGTTCDCSVNFSF